MSAEQAQVDVWGVVMRHIQTTLLEAREEARAMARLGRTLDLHEDAGHHDAAAWAYDHLLDQLLGLPAPVVPEDPEPGQGDLLELVCICHPVEDPWTYYGIVEPGGALEPDPGCPAHFPDAQPVDNPGDGGL